MSEWKPIDSAPKDGTRVLIHVTNSERLRVCEAWWARPYEAAPDDQCWWQTADYRVLPEHAAHWMPRFAELFQPQPHRPPTP